MPPQSYDPTQNSGARHGFDPDLPEYREAQRRWRAYLAEVLAGKAVTKTFEFGVGATKFVPGVVAGQLFNSLFGVSELGAGEEAAIALAEELDRQRRDALRRQGSGLPLDWGASDP